MEYSREFKNKIVGLRNEGWSYHQLNLEFKIPRKTIVSWVIKYKEFKSYNCFRCGLHCDKPFGMNRYCSIECASPRKVKVKHSKTCRTCNENYETLTVSTTSYCSMKCNPNVGGARNGYKGFYCGSSWELAFLIWALDNNISIERCAEKFSYKFNGETKSYLPDFKIRDIYIEIKGYFTEQVKSKTNQCTATLIVLGENDLTPVFTYVKNTYGKNYISMYEGNPHNQKNNKCKECGTCCKNIYCSTRCSAFGNKKLHVAVTPTGIDPVSKV
jgi:hypothetical protein